MLKSETQINFDHKEDVCQEILKILENSTLEKNCIFQQTFFHKTNIFLQEKKANIKVSFSNSFYILYAVVSLFFVFLPKNNAFIISSSLAAFVIFSTVMYFSLDYKIKTILDGF